VKSALAPGQRAVDPVGSRDRAADEPRDPAGAPRAEADHPAAAVLAPEDRPAHVAAVSAGAERAVDPEVVVGAERGRDDVGDGHQRADLDPCGPAQAHGLDTRAPQRLRGHAVAGALDGAGDRLVGQRLGALDLDATGGDGGDRVLLGRRLCGRRSGQRGREQQAEGESGRRWDMAMLLRVWCSGGERGRAGRTAVTVDALTSAQQQRLDGRDRCLEVLGDRGESTPRSSRRASARCWRGGSAAIAHNRRSACWRACP